MAVPIMSVPRTLALVRKQIEALKIRPDLEKGMPFPRAALEALRDRLVEIDTRQEQAKKSVVPLTRLLQETAFLVRESAMKNVTHLETSLGRYAAELASFGGRPLKGTHASPAAEGAAPDASASAKPHP